MIGCRQDLKLGDLHLVFQNWVAEKESSCLGSTISVTNVTDVQNYFQNLILKSRGIPSKMCSLTTMNPRSSQVYTADRTEWSRQGMNIFGL